MNPEIRSLKIGGLIHTAVIALFMVSFIAPSVLLAQSSIILNTQPTETEIPLANGTGVSIDPLTGNITATPADPSACSGTVDCSDVDVDIITFSVGPNPVSQAGTINLNWSSRGAWSCTGSGLPGTTWDGAGKLPDGSQSVSAAPLAVGSYDVVLTCSNGPVTDQETRTIVVNTDPGPTACVQEGRVPPVGLTRDTSIILGSGRQTLTYEDVFSSDFPGGTDVNIEIERDQYAALQFNTGNTPIGETGALDFNAIFSSQILSGRKIVTISECPGDFTAQADPGCDQNIFVGGINWRMGGAQDCNLDQNTTYYINILYTNDSQPPSNWFCTAHAPSGIGRCGNTFNP